MLFYRQLSCESLGAFLHGPLQMQWDVEYSLIGFLYHYLNSPFF